MNTPAPRYDEYGFEVPAKGPRPQARTGGLLIVAGGVIHVICVFLPWYTNDGLTLRGMDTFVTTDGTGEFAAPGKVWLVVGGLLIALGVTLAVAGRIFGIAILALLIAVAGVFTSLLGVGSAKNQRDFLGTGDASYGAFIGIIAILVAIAGSIHVLTKRAR